MKKILVLLFLITSTITSVYAQRMYKNQSALQFSYGVIDGNFASGNIGLQYSMYKSSGQIIAAVDYSFLQSKYEFEDIPYNQICFSAGYLFRVISNYKRSIVFSAGLCATGAYESIKSDLGDGKVISQKSKFLYGVIPQMSLDFFLSRKTAISVLIKEQLYFNSSISTNHFVAGFGIKYLIN